MDRHEFTTLKISNLSAKKKLARKILRSWPKISLNFVFSNNKKKTVGKFLDVLPQQVKTGGLAPRSASWVFGLFNFFWPAADYPTAFRPILSAPRLVPSFNFIFFFFSKMQWRKILQVSGTWSRSALCLCTTSRHFRDQPTKHTRNSGELGTLALEKLKTTNHGIFFFFHSDANHMTLWFWFRCPKPNNKKTKAAQHSHHKQNESNDSARVTNPFHPPRGHTGH